MTFVTFHIIHLTRTISSYGNPGFASYVAHKKLHTEPALLSLSLDNNTRLQTAHNIKEI